MGKRGPRAEPVHVKIMKGNPGNRPLPTQQAVVEIIGPTRAIAMPDYLKTPRERALFSAIIGDYFQRRVASPVDVNAYGRWAHLQARWIDCKEKLEKPRPKKKNGQVNWGRDPLLRELFDLERLIMSQEDRLGLNPVSRQNIVRGLATMPSALGGSKAADEEANAEPVERSPIGIGRTVN